MEHSVSKIETFFRHCPACGRRFEIRLISKRATDTREEAYERKIPVPAGGYGSPRSGFTPGPLIVQEDIPTVVEVTDFNYTYRCRHCGHQWTETRSEQT